MPATSYAPQLRPLSVGEILDAGFKLLRDRFGALMLCVLVPVVPLTILATLLQASTDENAFDLNSRRRRRRSGAAVVGSLLGAFLQGAADRARVAACIKVISAAYLGEQAGVSDSLRYGLSRILPLIGAYILIVLILIPAFIALIIPGIFLAVKVSVTFAAVVVERAGPGNAIWRSFSLTRDNWWRAFGGGRRRVPDRGRDQLRDQQRARRRPAHEPSEVTVAVLIHDPEHHHLRDHLSAVGGRAHGPLLRPARAQRGLRPPAAGAGRGGGHVALRVRAGAPGDTCGAAGSRFDRAADSAGGFAPPEGPATSS